MAEQAHQTEAGWRRDPVLPFQRMDEETIVVDPRSREVHLLNGTAARIWELLERERSMEELVTALGDEYEGAPADTVRAEVQAFVTEMGAKGLVHAASGQDEA
jgi:PqqD family protein of HPr-rel-A system